MKPKKQDKKLDKMLSKIKKKEEKKKKDLKKEQPKKPGAPNLKMIMWFVFLAALVLGSLVFLLTRNVVNSLIVFAAPIALFVFYTLIKKRLQRQKEIKKMEEVFPDFISLMASNLRAGMTVDRALLLSSRKEFAPLDKEILQLGKDILTAKEITLALREMGKRIGSEEITKTIQLIISGIRSGGNLSVLLEETANNMRERIFVKKRAASNVLMYVIFIFFATAIGAPVLFGLSSVLVEVMSNIFSGASVAQTNINLPFTITEINISTAFIFYFSLFFLIATDVLASLVLGLVSKGKEREGMKYIIPLVASGVTIFLLSRFVLLRYFAGFLG